MLEQGRYASGSSKHFCGIANIVAIDLSLAPPRSAELHTRHPSMCCSKHSYLASTRQLLVVLSSNARFISKLTLSKPTAPSLNALVAEEAFEVLCFAVQFHFGRSSISFNASWDRWSKYLGLAKTRAGPGCIGLTPSRQVLRIRTTV